MARSGRWDDPWQRFPPSKPIKVEGGLAASRPRGAIGDSWWSRRFVQVLESYGLGTRLERGRRYARQGQILSLDVSPGLLAAQVQGSRPTPYLVTVSLRPPTEKQWQVLDTALRTRVGLAANLLAGDVPAELEEVFAQAKAPLFPGRWADLQTRCSCPDSANPCKHIAATLYLLADRLDSDPWLLLEWRGRSRDEVLAALGLNDSPPEADDELPPWWPLRVGEPLPDRSGPPAVLGVAAGDGDVDAVLRRLDTLDATAWKAPVAEQFRALYEAVLDPPD